MNKVADTRLVLRRTYKASRERLFDAFTDPEEIKKWYAPVEGWAVSVAEVDLRVGGSYHFEFGPPGEPAIVEYGRYIEIVRGEKLVWEMDLKGRTSDEQTVTVVEFLDRDGMTEVVVTEEGYSSKHVRDMHVGGWSRMLDQLGGLVG
jgi:uncharacterized protein YndB with AHSA1/START domain